MNNDKGWENFYNPQLFGKLGCTLQAYGALFEPDTFLSQSGISQEKVIFHGGIRTSPIILNETLRCWKRIF